MARPILATLSILFAFSSMAVAQAPPDEKTRKAMLLKAELFMAITERDAAAAKAALARGADPNARNWLEFTPLMWAAGRGNKEIVDALLARGAKLDAGSIYGSALTFAAMGRHEKLAISLLDKGANPDPSRGDGVAPLMLAAVNGDTDLTKQLLKRKLNPNRKDTDGATPLIFAVRLGRISTARILLGAGADPNLADSHARTPLMYAAANGQPEVVDLLLSRRAAVDRRDDHKATALLLAARYSGDAAVIRSLLRAGANPAAVDSTGKTALTLATVRQFQDAASLLRGAGARGAVQVVSSPEPVSPNKAIERSLGALQPAMKIFAAHSNCTSCHHQGIGLMALASAGHHGFKVDQKLIGDYLKRMGDEGKESGPYIHMALTDPNVGKTIPAVDIGDMSIGGAYIFGGMLSCGIPPNPGFSEMSLFLAGLQKPDGHWGFGMDREPIQSSNLTVTAFTLRVLRAYGPEDKLTPAYEQAKKWLLTTATPNSEDKASRLLGLKWAGASKEEMARALSELLTAQRPDGGWSQLPSMRSDAYATGLALYALRIAGEAPPTDSACQKAVSYLLRTQDEDGSWYVNKRAAPANTYFDAGFPHGESQFISFSATCWAMMALLESTGPPQAASR